MVEAVNILHESRSATPTPRLTPANKAIIRATSLRRGLEIMQQRPSALWQRHLHHDSAGARLGRQYITREAVAKAPAVDRVEFTPLRYWLTSTLTSAQQLGPAHAGCWATSPPTAWS